MDMGIDTGPIILQRKFKVTDADTAKSVYDNFTKLGTDIFEEFVEKWIKKRVPKSKIQNEKNASYYPKGLPNDGNIDWNWNGLQIYNFIRSMTFEPFPPASFYIGKKKMVIVEEKYFKGFK
jgi:methionyl-tRNA formyltransferase